MITFFKRLFCKHYKVTIYRNIYSDEINAWSGDRSLWECAKCGVLVPSEHLHHSEQEPKQ